MGGENWAKGFVNFGDGYSIQLAKVKTSWGQESSLCLVF